MATQKKTTRKLSGPSKDHFFDRFFGDDKSLAEETAQRLSQRSKAVFTSVRVRKPAWLSRHEPGRRITAKPAIDAAAPESAPAKQSQAPKPAKPVEPRAPSASPTTTASDAQSAFDPFIFGLVPTFKREGAEGIRAKLKEVDRIDNLRSMAKAQQIILPKEICRDEVKVDNPRKAVLAAVEQSVSDRKAQL